MININYVEDRRSRTTPKAKAKAKAKRKWSKYSPYELNYIRENLDTIPAGIMAEQLGRTLSSIYTYRYYVRQAKEMNTSKVGKFNRKNDKQLDLFPQTKVAKKVHHTLSPGLKETILAAVKQQQRTEYEMIKEALARLES